MTRFRFQTLLGLILVIVATIVILWPLARPGFFISDDGEWMVIRLTAFFQALRDGQFPVRFLGRLNHSYGYPVANFLYPGFLYLGSFIHALGFSFVDSIKIIMAVSVVGASLFIFGWLKARFKTFPSLIGTLGFVFAPYLSFDLYRRGSVGEVLAFFPAAAGLYGLAVNNTWLLTLAVAGLIVSHNTLAMLFLGMYVILIFWRRTYQLFLPLVVGTGMAGFFWLPAMFEQRFVIFDAIKVSNPINYFVSQDTIWLVGVAGLIASLLVFRERKKSSQETIMFLAIFAVSTMMATRLTQALWSAGLLAQLVQFPYRFLAPAAVVGSWIIALSFERVSQRWRLALVLLFSVIWLWGIWPIFKSIVRIQRPEGYYATNEATTNVADEYLPRWVSLKAYERPATKIEFVKSGGLIKQKLITNRRIEVEVVARDESLVQFNTLYYPGWGVLLDGEPTSVDFQNPLGVMRVLIPAGSHQLVAEFRETPLRLAADLLSVVSGLFWLGLNFRKKSK